MRTQIQIHESFIELFEEPNLNITKSVADIKEPETRTADRTLTIDIPGSHTNNKLFSFIFNVNLEITNTSDNFNPDFDPNKRAYILITIDTIQQFVGYCQLTDIVINNEDKITYKIVAYGQIADLISTVGQALLTDLDLSEFDHDYTHDNISNSWATSIIENGSPTAFDLGKGYVYPMIDFGYKSTLADYRDWRVEDFKPAIYVKQIVDKIFAYAGFTYTSDFFDSERFKRIIVPFSNERLVLSQSDVFDRSFYAGMVGTQSILNTANTPIIFNDDTNSPFFDNDNNYNDTTGEYVVKKKGIYNLKAFITSRLELNGTITVQPQFFDLTFGLKINGSIVATATRTLAFPQPAVVGPGALSDPENFEFNLPNYTLFPGDTITITPLQVWNSTFQVLEPSSKFDVNIYEGSTFFNEVVNEQIFEDFPVTVNSVLPKDFLQRDFIGGIVKMFNLYFEPDPNNDTHLYIEPRIDFYTDDVVDWTQKLDNSKDVTIKPMAFLDSKRYNFTYKNDKDYYNSAYLNEFNYSYGRKYIDIDNDFLKNEKVIELPFAPTILTSNNFDNKVLSNISFVDQNGNVNLFSATAPRILYFENKSCNFWRLTWGNGGASAVFNQYPYAGHLDDFISASFDLNFGLPQRIFFNNNTNISPAGISYTNQNLYNIYWNEDIIQRADKNSKILEAFFYLKPIDIFLLSFRKLYFIKSQYYRLLELSNYDPLNASVTRCVFVKYIDVEPIEPNNTNANGGGGQFGGQDLPLGGGGFDVLPNGNTNPTTGLLAGNNNRNSGDINNIVIGDFNNVGVGSNRISLFSSSGVIVSSGIENVTAIGCQDMILNESNTIYFKGVRFNLMGGESQVITANYIVADNDYYIEADATSGALTVTIPNILSYRKEITVTKTDALANNVVVQDEALTALATLTTQGQSATVYKGITGLYLKSKN